MGDGLQRRRGRRRNRLTCVAASGCALLGLCAAVGCFKNNSFSVPPPLLDPVKDKNQPLSSLPPSPQGSAALSKAI